MARRWRYNPGNEGFHAQRHNQPRTRPGYHAMLDVDAEIRKALKGKDHPALLGYRAVKAKMGAKMTEAGRGEDKTLSEEEVLAVIAREIKERKEANEYLDESRPEYSENARIASLLEAYLPARLSPGEQEAAIQTALVDVQAAVPKDMGKVMGALRQVQGLDMGSTSARVKELLAEME